MIEVIPSLPAQTFDELRTKIGMVRGLVSTFQIDVCDGLFVTNRSWPMNPGDRDQFERIVRGIETLPYAAEFEFEVDLMAHTPERIIPDWVRAGAIRALIHIEAKHDFSACRAAAGDRMELGIALSIGTPISRIEAYREHIGVVQVMGIAEIGVQGQPFDPRSLIMIREIREQYPELTVEVDGAVNRETAPEFVAAGVSRLAPGSYVFKSEDPGKAVTALRSLPVS